MKLFRKLIDPKLLLEDLGEEPHIWTDTDAEIQEHSDWLRFKKMIELQPTVDAVEVVRCRDCKYWVEEKELGMFCGCWGGMLTSCKQDDFCSYGERKDEVEQ
jgi:hypothetical protein